MEIQNKHIKLNMPCWICDKDLILGQAITTFGDNSHKSPAHLDCVRTQAISEFKEKLKQDYLPMDCSDFVDFIDKTAQEMK